MKVMIPKSKINVSTTPEFIKSPIKLSISLLVSNRIGTIRKCMESLKVIMDQVPSELIAVDTVGEENSDGSLAVVREYTDKIVHFDWTGDFSEARNAGMKLAQGEWFLFVDDDEWFEDPTELIEFFHNGDYLKYGCTQYAIRNYLDDSMTSYSEAWVSRMGRRTKEMRFIYPVHEMMYPMYRPEKKFVNCYAYHVGYIFSDPTDRKKHFERNILPILEELEQKPNDMRLIMQAVQEYMFDCDYDKAEEFCRRGELDQNPQYDLIWNWIVAMLVQTLILAKKPEQVLREGKRLLEMPRMNIDYMMVCAAQELKDNDAVIKYGMDFEQLAQYFDENPDQVLKFVMLSLRDILMEDKREVIHNTLFLSCKNSGRYDELCKYSDILSWDKEYMKQKQYFFFVVESAVNSGNYACVTRAVEKICKQGEFPKDWAEDLEQICKNEKTFERKYFLSKALADVESIEPHFLILRAWCAEQDNRNVQIALQECLNRGLDCAVPREELLGICLRTDNNPKPFLEPLYLEDWILSFSQLVKNTRREDLQKLLDCAQKTLQPIDQSQYFVLSQMIRERMLEDPHFSENQLWETAKTYVGDIISYYQSLYREELFENNIKQNLPREAVFALKLQEALRARECRDFEGMTQTLKECVKAYPWQKDLVNRLLEQVELDMQTEQKLEDEFIEMGEKIKYQIHQMIRSGKLTEAQQILEQLKDLLPNDVELEELEQKILMGERLKSLTSLMD